MLVVLASACAARTPPQAGVPTVPPDERPIEETAALPDPALAPTNRDPGERIELMIPLIGGQSLPLAQLRGRVVVVELTATWVERWPETYAFYNRMIEQHGREQLAVVVVALDNERSSLSPEPGTRAPGFELGWDPQGAVAARLQAAALPTVIVLDREGVMVHHQGGGPAGATEVLESRVREVVQGRSTQGT